MSQIMIPPILDSKKMEFVFGFKEFVSKVAFVNKL